MLAFLISAMMLASTSPSILTVPVVHAEELTKEWTQDEVREYAIEVAKEFGLHQGRFLQTLACENGFNAKGQSNHYYKGKREQSFGAAQINLPSHPTVTQEMAEDPTFALPWMAQKFLDGYAFYWTCWRGLSSSS